MSRCRRAIALHDSEAIVRNTSSKKPQRLRKHAPERSYNTQQGFSTVH